MKQDSNSQDIMRRLLGAVLASGLSSREIENLADRLMTDPDVAYDLGSLLRIHLQLTGIEPPDKRSNVAKNESNWLKIALDTVNRRAISKKELVSLVQDFGAKDISASTLLRLSVRDILARVLDNATNVQSSAFLKQLGANVESDPYLKGIEQR